MKFEVVRFKVADKEFSLLTKVAIIDDYGFTLVCNSLDEAFKVSYAYNRSNLLTHISHGDLGYTVRVDKK